MAGACARPALGVFSLRFCYNFWMNKKYFFMIAAGAVIVASLIAAYFYFPKKTIDLPTESLAAVVEQSTDDQQITTTIVAPQNEAVSAKDRILAKDGFTILVPAGWVEVKYAAETTIIANPNEENFDPALKKSGFKSYFSVTREKMGERTWDQAVDYVEMIVNGSAPEIEYISERDGTIAGNTMHFWEADLARDGMKFKVLVYAVRGNLLDGNGDNLWILTFNTGASMWPAYSRLAPKVFESLTFQG